MIRMMLARFDIPRFNPHLGVVGFAALLLCFALGFGSVSAQQKMSKRYPAGKNVRIELKNISGTIVVESWNRDEIKLSATLESPKANLTPRQTGEGLVVDVMGDNRGRGDIGNVNFQASGARQLFGRSRNETRKHYRHEYSRRAGARARFV